MVTLIRTLKRVIISSPPTRRSGASTSTTKFSMVAQTPENAMATVVMASRIHHDGQLKKTANTAADVIKLNNDKVRAPSDSDNASKNNFSSAADTTLTNSEVGEKSDQTQSDRKRKSSPGDEELALTLNKIARKRLKCSANYHSNICFPPGANGCTNHVVERGVWMKHGARKRKKRCRCSSEGCTNEVQTGGVCIKHGAETKKCSSHGCKNKIINGGVCIRHGAKRPKRKLCSSEGCTSQAKKRGVCIRHGAYQVING